MHGSCYNKLCHLVNSEKIVIRFTKILTIFWFHHSGAADYPCFRGLLKQLVGPLSTQLSDRRSSIVKQV